MKRGNPFSWSILEVFCLSFQNSFKDFPIVVFKQSPAQLITINSRFLIVNVPLTFIIFVRVTFENHEGNVKMWSHLARGNALGILFWIENVYILTPKWLFGQYVSFVSNGCNSRTSLILLLNSCSKAEYSMPNIEAQFWQIVIIYKKKGECCHF